MWTVLEERKVSKQLDKAPKEIQVAYELWKAIVVNQGPMGLLQIKGYKDHALKGKWKGARSSSLNDHWRVIYVYRDKQFQFLTFEVTPHDYRKRD